MKKEKLNDNSESLSILQSLKTNAFHPHQKKTWNKKKLILTFFINFLFSLGL